MICHFVPKFRTAKVGIYSIKRKIWKEKCLRSHNFNEIQAFAGHRPCLFQANKGLLGSFIFQLTCALHWQKAHPLQVLVAHNIKRTQKTQNQGNWAFIPFNFDRYL
jgi:hypothetical protein